MPDPGPPRIRIGVDLRDGRVFAFRALSGYRGALFGRISAGMPLPAVLGLDSRVVAVEGDPLAVFEGVEGVDLFLDGEDDLDRATIAEISVFEPDRGPRLPF